MGTCVKVVGKKRGKKETERGGEQTKKKRNVFFCNLSIVNCQTSNVKRQTDVTCYVSYVELS